ncbi:hypothetical protein Goshw_028117 [Gossypium schwendimanii]|uniref:RNase H type-1 domain-containing protein n=1 Tax=Gossypium schwendimanii TaxID=34291 RepID=A0A7J9MQI4_GOSSC|nr:hypothetical protein [Gossypium schwendimanii]
MSGESGFLVSTGVWENAQLFILNYGTNSLEVLEAIHESNSKSSCSVLMRIIHQLLDIVRNWILEQILREDNKKADQMAKIIFDRGEEL